jgi:hypothetical protein
MKGYIAIAVAAPPLVPPSPLGPMTAPHDASSAPKPLLHRRHGRAGRKRRTPYTLSCSSMRSARSSGCLAFTLPQGAILMPPKTSRGQALPLEPHRATQALHHRRRRIAHVHSRVQRCRLVKDRRRLWQQGGRELGMERCCTLHHFRVRLRPWQPMI